MVGSKAKSGKANEERGEDDWAALPFPVVSFCLASLPFPRQSFSNLMLHVRLNEGNFLKMQIHAFTNIQMPWARSEILKSAFLARLQWLRVKLWTLN